MAEAAVEGCGGAVGVGVAIKIYSTRTLIACAFFCSAYVSSQPPQIERTRTESENSVCEFLLQCINTKQATSCLRPWPVTACTSVCVCVVRLSQSKETGYKSRQKGTQHEWKGLRSMMMIKSLAFFHNLASWGQTQPSISPKKKKCISD